MKFAALACAALMALAAPPAARAQAEVDKADAILAKVREYYRGLKSFTFDATMDNRTEVQGMKIDMKVNYKAAATAPNKFSFIGEGDSAGAMGMSLAQSVVCDGESLYRYIKMFNSYTQEPAPKTFDGIVFGGMDPMGADAMLFGLFVEPEKSFSILKALKRKEYLGTEKIDGAECHKLKLVSGAPSIPDLEDAPEGMELATLVWIESGERPLVRRIQPDFGGMLKNMFGGGSAPGAAGAGLDDAMSDMLAGMKLEIDFGYKNWNVAAEVPAERFKFTPPTGAKKTANFMDAMGDGLGALAAGADEKEEEEAPDQPATVLEKKAAPAFKIGLLSGGEFELAAHKGKVVILDFWATWCAPCIKAMPVIKEVADSFKDKGVVLLAINLEDKPEEIQEFLKKHKIDVAVGLDTKGEIGALYKTDILPETVIIGKDGVIKKVHLELKPTLKEELTAEVTAALAE